MANATTDVIMREVILIDEELCDGCGQCVPACAEGALQIIEGKAKLVSDVFCDGMGACLGHCPQGAITIERRPAAAYSEAAVEQHLAQTPEAPQHAVAPAPHEHHGGCPGSAARMIQAQPSEHSRAATVANGPAQNNDAALKAALPGNKDAASRAALPGVSELRNWPVELKLAPLQAPYFDEADLLISADCVAFAHPDFHRRLLKDRTLLIGCPKLDDAEFYAGKLTEIFRRNSINSVSVVFMEVPCCFGLVSLVQQALAACGKQIPATALRIGLNGEEQERHEL